MIMKDGCKVSFNSSEPEPTDEDCISYFAKLEKGKLNNLTLMYKIHRKKGESILEAFYNVQNTYLEILLKSVDDFHSFEK